MLLPVLRKLKVTKNFHYESFKIIGKKITPLFTSVVDRVDRMFSWWDRFIFFGKDFKHWMDFANIYICIVCQYADRWVKYSLCLDNLLFYVFCSFIKIFIKNKKILWSSIFQVQILKSQREHHLVAVIWGVTWSTMESMVVHQTWQN